jgi:hypothetical protein
MKFRGRAVDVPAFTALVAGSLLLVVLVGCTDQGVRELRFENRTVVRVQVLVLYPDTGNEFTLQTAIEPGKTAVTRSDVYPGGPCSDRGVLIARDDQGREVARRAGQLCKGDTWVIEGPRTTSPSSSP